jgi:6-phosphogluconolactonase
MTNSIRRYTNLESVSLAAAEIVSASAEQSISSRGRFALALSGGRTPLRLYEILATALFRDKICWEAVHVFWGDERCVPSDDLRNNARMARHALLDLVPIPSHQIHPIRSEMPPAEAAAQYELELRHFFDNRPPVFDLILLGLGADGHTASLFPHAPALLENKRWVVDVFLRDQEMHRITLTAPLINRADQVVFMVSGEEKSAALRNVLKGPYRPHIYPAQLIRPKTGSLIWLLDKSASLNQSVGITGPVD